MRVRALRYYAAGLLDLLKPPPTNFLSIAPFIHLTRAAFVVSCDEATLSAMSDGAKENMRRVNDQGLRNSQSTV